MPLPSIISFKLLHISYIQNLKALFLGDIWCHFLVHDPLICIIDRQISPCLHRHVRPGNGFVPNFQLFERGNVNGNNEQALFTFLKVGYCLLNTIYAVLMQQSFTRWKDHPDKMCRIMIKHILVKGASWCHILKYFHKESVSQKIL